MAGDQRLRPLLPRSTTAGMVDLPEARIKVYVAIFLCLAVKAVHIEFVDDLTSEAFIAALRRFIARRGYCSTIHSDNGTNFRGASNELRELHDLLQSDDHKEKVTAFLADKQIEWRFIPPHSPHFGGLWEAAVKSLKRHLRRVASNELLTSEQLNTLIREAAVLNSHPQTPISTDPNDFLVLTPGHFLIGDSLMCCHVPRSARAVTKDGKPQYTNKASDNSNIQNE
ncbi:uncharacterized protein LOC117152278 [Bombus impatiens]|uniref:Uncharacterized protein LOC117152278 n=1 Tax=Bombus impatiens TaxID=132113 RepID=A0A6P8LBQ1_BOMIM|nr:uncharacterized protein LOC117152278 [Bombus impatiens]